jgi:hypothetical protein
MGCHLFWHVVCLFRSSSKKRPFDQGVECSECVVPIWDKHLGVKCVEGNCRKSIIWASEWVIAV